MIEGFMVQMQVSLDDEEFRMAERESAALGISVSEFIRRAVLRSLPSPREGAWMKYAGFVSSGDTESSRSIDAVVYGEKE